MIYKENKIKPIYGYFFMTISFLILFSPWQIGSKELYREEGLYAAMVSDIANSSYFTIHGHLTSIQPLFAHIAEILTICGLPIEFAMRSIGLFAIILLSSLAFFATSRSAEDKNTGYIAACITFSSFIILLKSLHGGIFFAGSFFIALGWFLWFRFAIQTKSWRYAWSFSILSAFIAFLFLGYSACFYFFFPLLFMRRPLTIWKRLNSLSFYIPAFILLTILFLWLCFTWNAIGISSNTPTIGDSFLLTYLIHLIKFPFEIILKLMPWSLIGWVPFCVKFQNMDKRPIISRYLRIIFTSLFFWFWLNPFVDSDYYILLITPFSIMVAINYDIVIRKYGHNLFKVIKYLSIIIFVLSFISFIFFITPISFLTYIADNFSENISKGIAFKNEYLISSIIKILLSMIISLYIYFYKKFKDRNIWTHLTLLSMSFILIFWAIKIPYESQVTYKKDCAEEIKALLKEKANNIKANVIYKKASLNLYGTAYYSGFYFIRIDDLKKLPKEENIIYLTNSAPTSERKWSKLGNVLYKKHKLSLWLGE